jgi:hypothetical protein
VVVMMMVVVVVVAGFFSGSAEAAATAGGDSTAARGGGEGGVGPGAGEEEGAGRPAEAARASFSAFSALRFCNVVLVYLSMVQSTDLDAMVEDRSSRDRLEPRRERFDAERRKLNALCNLPRSGVGPDISMSARNQTEQVSAGMYSRTGSIS